MVVSEEIVPAQCHEMTAGKMKVVVVVFGRPTNFSDIHDPVVSGLIARYAKKHGVSRIFAPRTTEATAEIVSVSKLLFPEKKTVNGVEIYYGVNADGVRLNVPGDGFFVASADCPTIVACLKKRGMVVAAHGALKSLTPPSLHLTPASPDRSGHSSVINAMLADYPFTSTHDSDCAQFGMFCGIGPEDYLHPFCDTDYGQHNARLVNWLIENYGEQTVLGAADGAKLFGQIDLVALVKAQLSKWGLSVDSTHFMCDQIDTYNDLCENGAHRYWSHRRWSVSNPATRPVDGRNGVLVLRTA